MTEFIDNEDYVYRRDSFESRICDDLCPVILKYLSIYDKIRFECISKQFKSCIFNKQNVLVINQSIDTYVLSNDLFNGLDPHIFDDMIPGNTTFKIINLIKFESILKKCKFITGIKIQTYINSYEFIAGNLTQVLRLITKYCKHLKVFDFYFENIDYEVIESFGKKFGQSLRHIKFDRNFEGKSALIKLCPNLVIIENVMFDDFVSEDEFIALKKLKHIVINPNTHLTDNDLFNTFVYNYDKQLNSVHYSIYFNDENDHKIIKQLSKLEAFEKLHLMYDENDVELNLLPKTVKLIANECKQLKHLTLSADQIFTDIFKPISRLKQLKSLYIICDNNDFDTIYESINLKGCKQLTQLSLHDMHLGNEFFNNIDKHLPQLKCLRIYENEITVSKQSLTSLSKLKNLKNISINCIETYGQSIDDIILELINNNKQIECIEFIGDYIMTKKSINVLISTALMRVNTHFRLKFTVRESVIKYWKKFENKPKNLLIEFEVLYEIIDDNGMVDTINTSISIGLYLFSIFVIIFRLLTKSIHIFDAFIMVLIMVFDFIDKYILIDVNEL